MGFCGFDNKIKENLKWTDKNFLWELKWLSILWFVTYIFYWVTSCQLWWCKYVVYSFGSVYQIHCQAAVDFDMQIIKWQQLAFILVTCRSLVFFFFFEEPWNPGGIYQFTQWHIEANNHKNCASINLVSLTKQNYMFLNGGYKTRVATGSPCRQTPHRNYPTWESNPFIMRQQC